MSPRLPQYTRVALSASNGSRMLMFLLVDGPVRTAMPMFDANTRLRNSGVETIWLFEESPIPSTKHMLCASVEWHGNAPVAKIMNVNQGGGGSSKLIALPALAKAAAELRLKVQGFSAGQRVAVTFESKQSTCTVCGATGYELDRATFHPEDDPGAPGLALNKDKIGKCVSGLIADALKNTGNSSVFEPLAFGRVCDACQGSPRFGNLRRQRMTLSIGSIELSSLAALELVRHHKTAWYIA